MNKEDQKYLKYLEENLKKSDLSESQKAYYKRILRVCNMPDLTKVKWNPVNMIVDRVVCSDYYKDFDIFYSPEIVKEFETFDLFYFPDNHVARRPSDSYFLYKSEDKDKNLLLRPHTTVMWYHYLKNEWLKKLENSWEIKVLSYWKTYRVDELDKTHHECFHQIDGLKISLKQKEIINQDTLKDVLSQTIKALFWEKAEYRFNLDSFPYTTDSLEVEVKNGDKWLEVLWAWVVKWEVLEKLWIDSKLYNGWAFWFWIERLAMALKKIPDIRIFWSQDERVLSQWWNLEIPYKEISQFPPVYKDISIIVPKQKFIIDENELEEIKLTRETESSFFAITWIIRDLWETLIEEVKIIDNFIDDEKFGKNKKSITISITFRSIERTLTNEEINKIYFEIREKLAKDLWYELR